MHSLPAYRPAPAGLLASPASNAHFFNAHCWLVKGGRAPAAFVAGTPTPLRRAPQKIPPSPLSATPKPYIPQKLHPAPTYINPGPSGRSRLSARPRPNGPSPSPPQRHLFYQASVMPVSAAWPPGRVHISSAYLTKVALNTALPGTWRRILPFSPSSQRQSHS